MSPLTEKERELIEDRKARTRIAVLVAFLSAVPPTIMAVAAWKTANETHHLVNSRMDEFKALLKEQSDAREAGREAARDAKGKTDARDAVREAEDKRK